MAKLKFILLIINNKYIKSLFFLLSMLLFAISAYSQTLQSLEEQRKQAIREIEATDILLKERDLELTRKRDTGTGTLEKREGELAPISKRFSYHYADNDAIQEYIYGPDWRRYYNSNIEL